MTLDACKAFDVVWQDSLLRKLFNVGIQGSQWVCLKNLYRDAFSSVKWHGQVSEPFEIKEGVKQWGILSTLHYKLYNNELLLLLQALRVGMSIGHTDCSCTTCSNDVALLAKFLFFLRLNIFYCHIYIDKRVRPQVLTTLVTTLPKIRLIINILKAVYLSICSDILTS